MRTIIKPSLTNRDVCLYSLFLTGGDVGFVATEDIAVKAFEIYPERFGLIRHPKYPDVDSARVTLTDLRKVKYGSLVEGNKKKGWRITQRGIEWGATNRIKVEAALKGKLSGERRVSSGHLLTQEKVRAARTSRVLTSDAYKKWKSGGRPTIYDFYNLMRIDNYTPESVYKEHLTALVEAVQDEGDMRKFLTEVARMYGESYRKNG